MSYKFVKYHTNSIGKSEMEGPERFILFAFEQFKPTKEEPRCELWQDGKMIGAKGGPTPSATHHRKG